jgi:hypothetical protein
MTAVAISPERIPFGLGHAPGAETHDASPLGHHIKHVGALHNPQGVVVGHRHHGDPDVGLLQLACYPGAHHERVAIAIDTTEVVLGEEHRGEARDVGGKRLIDRVLHDRMVVLGSPGAGIQEQRDAHASSPSRCGRLEDVGGQRGAGLGNS